MRFARTVWTPVVLGLVATFGLTLTPTTLSSHLWAETTMQIGNRSGISFESCRAATPLFAAELHEQRLFQPQVAVSPEQMRGLFFDTRIMKKLGAMAYAQGEPANAAIDGDQNTFWLAGNQKRQTREQVDLMIDFPEPVAMSGLVLMPGQNHREHEGDIREYVVQVSDDGNEWRDVVRGELVSTFAPQTISFPRNVKASHLKLISLSGFGPDKTTALAELAVIYAGPKLKDSGDGGIRYQRNKSAQRPIFDEGPGAVDKSKPKPTPRSKP